MISLVYKEHAINQRETDGYVNATQMCQINGKKVNDWTRTKETKAYIDGVAGVTGIPVTDLLITIQGGEPSEQGTWIHPKLAICLGRWIFVDFAIWCDEHIKTLMETGNTAIAPQPQLPQSYIEALKALVAAEEAKALLEAEKEILEQENLQLSEAVDELFDYSSIVRIAKFNQISETNFSWRRLKAVSEKLKLEIKKVPCPRFGEKNLYSHSAWRVAYPVVKLPETLTLVVSR